MLSIIWSWLWSGIEQWVQTATGSICCFAFVELCRAVVHWCRSTINLVNSMRRSWVTITADHRLPVESRRTAWIDAYCIWFTGDVLVSWVDRLQLIPVSIDNFIETNPAYSTESEHQNCNQHQKSNNNWQKNAFKQVPLQVQKWNSSKHNPLLCWARNHLRRFGRLIDRHLIRHWRGGFLCTFYKPRGSARPALCSSASSTMCVSRSKLHHQT